MINSDRARLSLIRHEYRLYEERVALSAARRTESEQISLIKIEFKIYSIIFYPLRLLPLQSVSSFRFSTRRDEIRLASRELRTRNDLGSHVFTGFAAITEA